jgi:hypothetical protein
MSAEKIITEEARLIILRQLNESAPNFSMTSSALQDVLRTMFAIVRDRRWIEEQLEWLEHEGAIRLTPAGSVQIATLTGRARMHLSHESFIAGVKRTTLPVAVN